jgi:predicted metalloprotease
MTPSAPDDPDPPRPATTSGEEPPLEVGSWRPGPYDGQQLPQDAGRDQLSTTIAVLLIIGVVGAIVLLAVRTPTRQIAGIALPVNTIPPVPSSTPAPPSPPPTSTRATSAPPADPRSALARHPLSTSNATLATTVCSLSRFDPADERQTKFFQEAKICADAVWGTALTAAGLPTLPIQVVTVQGGPMNTQCGPVNPTDRPTECRATVYMTPAYLRDVEHNNRFPGRYFGVFLREYAKAAQEATGLTALQAAAKNQPGASAADLDTRLAQQATCLAGAASGAMAGQGAVDNNITNEIRDRLSTVDAPDDATSWLTKGFQSRQFTACNTWTS